MDRSGRDTALLGTLLRGFRRGAGLTQLELAGRSGLSLGSVRDLEQGRTRRPLPGSLAVLAAALGLNPAQAGELERAVAGRGLWLQVLGPLAVWRDGAVVPLGGPAQRAVLGLLAVSPGSLVHRTKVIDVLWPDSPPANAVNLVQAHVSRLRKILASGDPAGRGECVCSAGASYRLRAGAGQLDLLRFGQLTAGARAACSRGDCDGACGLYQDAVGLWRGEPLADVELLRSHPAVAGLARQRAAAVIEYAGVASAAGSHGRVLALLRELAAREPLNEQAHAQLMVALAGCGQQAEALAVYHSLRRRLDDELAMPPGADLAGAYQLVLRQDIPATRPAVAAADAGTASASRHAAHESAVPRQLPAAPPSFVGRTAELAALSGLLDAAAHTVVITAIGGTAGIGKTALAVHWARQIAAEFPDGQLYVNLRGFDPGGRPVACTDVIRGFLDAFGVAPGQIPASLEAQAALYRSMAADRRLLIVLDNARDVDQVRPLLPGSAGCLVLVTSRARLAGLAVGEGANLLTLGALTKDEARQLLASRLGVWRTGAEPAAVDELIALCARLPLGLAIAAARAADRRGFPLAELAAELRDAATRLDALDGGDAASSVRAAFSWSYQNLQAPAARMFRLLGLHPGPDITVPAAASLAGIAPSAAGQAFRELTAANLLTEHLSGRYGFHDLLRAYAAEQADAIETEAARREARHRVLDHYLRTAYRAAMVIQPQRDPLPLAGPERGVAPESLADEAQAQAWLQAEHRVLLAAVALAVEAGFDVHAWQIPWTLAGFLDWRGHWQEAARIQRIALDATVRLGDAAGRAVACRLLAITCWRFGDHEQARTYLEDCVRLSRQRGDRTCEARTQQNLGVVAADQGRYADALGHVEQAHDLFLAVGDRAGEASSRSALGSCHILLGDYERARTLCREALGLLSELGLRHGEAHAWYDTGRAEHQLGYLTEAADCYQRALSLFRELGHRYYEADVLGHLGDTCRAAGDPSAAREAWQRSLVILDDLQHPDAEGVRAKLSDLYPDTGLVGPVFGGGRI